MREIKFRGKSIENKNIGEWVVGDLHLLSPFVHIHTGLGIKCKIDPNTVGQFTGLKDKNDRDIYEGDILRSDTYPYSFYEEKDNYYAVVWWSDDNAAFVVETRVASHAKVKGISNGNCEYLGELLLKEEDSAFEVIGNIHDNPELLKSL